MTKISLLVRINAQPEDVYENLSTANGIAKWFTDAVFSKNEVTEELRLQLWGDTDFKVVEMSPPTRVVWHCISEDNPWFGTDIVFDLKRQSDKTVVIFDHLGWPETSDFYRDCAMSWAYFLESLRSLIEEGKGTPEDRAPTCDAS